MLGPSRQEVVSQSFAIHHPSSTVVMDDLLRQDSKHLDHSFIASFRRPRHRASQ